MEPAESMPVRAYRGAERVVAALFLAASRASLLLVLAAVLFSTDPPVTPPVLFRMVLVLVFFPGLVAWAVRRACAAAVSVEGERLVLAGRRFRVEVPCTSIERVVPWVIPLPGAGLGLRLRSGRRLGWAVEAADPALILETLAERAGVADARPALQHPSVVYARAKARPRRWYQPLVKFVLFGALPAGVLFRAHQYISYGGAFGQWNLEGLVPYLTTLAVYWATVCVYLVLYASLWRALAEGAALLGAWVVPSRAATTRRAVEAACRLLYYGGVPLLLLLRFLP
jgi:hypothetical protein